jgi:hypothetical protein
VFSFVRDLERSPDDHINGRVRPERADAKRRGLDSIAVHARDKIMGPKSSPENAPAPTHLKSPSNSAYNESSVYRRFPSLLLP